MSEILNDIFGYKVDGVHFLGLVDAKSEDDFRDKLAALKSKWDTTEDKFRRVEKGAHTLPSFHAWFVTYQSNVMMETMITPVRQRAGLGTPPDPFYTNPSESINRELKRVVDRRPCDLSVFIEKIFSLIQQQNDRITQAVVRNGEWRLRNGFKFLEVSSDSWYNLSEKQRKTHMQRVLHTQLDEDTIHTTAIVLHDDDSEVEDTYSHLSASYRDLLLPDHSNDAVIQAIWKKAGELCNQPGLVVHVPGAAASLHRMVASKSGDAPHFVKTPPTLTGQFICDDRCLNYKTYKICSHTVAAAESSGKLREFVAWYKKNKSVNLDALSKHGLG